MIKNLTILLFVCALSISVFAQGDRLISQDIVKIYPNPLKSESIIKIDPSVEVEKNNISIHFYNLIGAEVHRIESVQATEVRIDKFNFENGVYLYQLKSNSKILSTGKLTVN